MRQTITRRLIAALYCLIATAIFAPLHVQANCTNGVKIPAFLASGIDPNLLLIIDNSASMNDLAYIGAQGTCYDDGYSSAEADWLAGDGLRRPRPGHGNRDPGFTRHRAILGHQPFRLDIADLGDAGRMNILFHICCAPCAIYPLSHLRKQGFSIQGYFYNPNFHPYLEYQKRMSTVQEFSARAGLSVSYRDGYDLDEFLNRVAGKGPGRCEQCYRMRLDAAAAETSRSGSSLFTTSLLYSKYQNHDLIRAVAEEVAREHRVELYYEDFRIGWREGAVESKAMGLYRQQYCGCVYSERDRYKSR